VNRPIPLQPASFRRFIETNVMIALAGETCELARPSPPTGTYIASSFDDNVAHGLIHELVGLTPSEQKRLANAADANLQSDDDAATQYIGFIAEGSAVAVAYLRVPTNVDAGSCLDTPFSTIASHPRSGSARTQEVVGPRGARHFEREGLE
jgi:hypothetical protein